MALRSGFLKISPITEIKQSDNRRKTDKVMVYQTLTLHTMASKVVKDLNKKTPKVQ